VANNEIPLADISNAAKQYFAGRDKQLTHKDNSA
jgi:hypothetical protein